MASLKLISLPSGISVIIPVYNSSEILPSLISRLDVVLQECGAKYEIILVCDGCNDDSWEVIKNLRASYLNIRGILLARNYGQNVATLVGMKHAIYATSITMDDDLQHPPEEIPKLLRKLDEGYDVVCGIPKQENHSKIRIFLKRIAIKACVLFTGDRVLFSLSGFQSFRTALVHFFPTQITQVSSVYYNLLGVTNKLACIPTIHSARPDNKKNYTIGKLVSILSRTLFSSPQLSLRVFYWAIFVFISLFVISILASILYGSAFLMPWLAIELIMLGIFLSLLIIFGLAFVMHFFKSTAKTPCGIVRDYAE